ncbi:MAG: transketolase family protein [Clostridiales bacterium]|nr:transketolase family protein [Clostridiales bacterium]
MAEKQSTRVAYGEALAELGAKDARVLVADADLAHATMTVDFATKFPDRFYNFGIAEANMMCASSGLAHCGYTVFASTFALFGAGRAYEQIRNAICYTGANVKLGLSHAGPSAGEDGGSHQAVEDIALMRVLPGMKVLVPCDAIEMKKAVFAAAEIDGPAFIRTGRLPTDICTEASTPFEIGKAVVLREGADVAIIACGIMVAQALYAAAALEAQGISAAVVNMHTIKPLDEACVLEMARRCGAIVTAEEHSVIGGLGGAVAETLAGNACVPFERVGIQDRFGQSGKPQDLFREYGLTAEAVQAACRHVIDRKSAAPAQG